MTRKELVQMREYKIGTASTKWYNKHPDAGPIDSFEAGVKWCEKNPPSQWKNAKRSHPSPDPKLEGVESVEVLVYTNYRFYTKARYSFEYKDWYMSESDDLYFDEDEEVLYWMPLPKPPKDKKR